MSERAWEVEIQREGHGTLRVRAAVPGSASLGKLCDLVSSEFALPQAPYSFFLSGVPWDERTQFGGRGAEAPYKADKTRIDRLAWRTGTRLLLGLLEEPEVWLQLRVVGLAPPSVGGLRVLERAGSLERTDEQRAEALRLSVRLAEMLALADDYAELGCGPVEDDRLDDLAQLQREYELALRVCAWVGASNEDLEMLCVETDSDVREWLLLLPDRLELVGQQALALQLCELASEGPLGAMSDATHISLLLTSEQPQAALAAAERALKRYPDNEFVQFWSARACFDLGSTERAEALLRGVVDNAKYLELAAEARSELVELLERSGREPEAEALREAALAEELREIDEQEHEAPAKVGRNEPCPCGSGQKYKRCCGAQSDVAGSEEAMVVEWMGHLVRFGQNEPEMRTPALCLATFGGDEFRELSIPEALPLFSGDDSELHFQLWSLLDFALPGGEPAAVRYARRYRSRGTPRQRAVLERLLDSRLQLFEIMRVSSAGRAVLRDVLDPREPERSVRLGTDELWPELWIAARAIEIDGEFHLLPGALVFETVDERQLVEARLREAQQRSGLEWSLFLKRDGHLFHRAAREASLTPSALS